MKLRLPLQLVSLLISAFSFVGVQQTISAADSISINFYRNSNSLSGKDEMYGLEQVAGKFWNASNTLKPEDYLTLKNQLGQESSAKGIWSAGGSWNFGTTNPDRILDEYLFGGVSIDVKDLSFFSYSVYIYSSDTNPGFKFAPVTVNGISYIGTDEGKTVTGDSPWGSSAEIESLIEGKNTLHVEGLSGDLSLSNIGGSGPARTISGLQIIDTYEGKVKDVTLTDNATWSAAVGTDSDAQTVSVQNIATATLSWEGNVATEGIILKQGTLILSGSSMSFSESSILRALSGTTIVLDTAFDSKVTLAGGGTFSINKDWTLDASKVTLQSNLNNGSHLLSISVNEGKLGYFTGNVTGTGKVEKTGKGTLQWDNTTFDAATGLTIKEGTVLWNVTSVIKNGLEIGKEGILQIGDKDHLVGGKSMSDSNTDKIVSINEGNLKGNGCIKIYAHYRNDETEDLKGATGGVKLNLGTDFQGYIDMQEGALYIKDSTLGKATIILNGTGTGIQTGWGDTTVSNNITLQGAGSSFIRAWASFHAILSGKITGTGTLSQWDSGSVSYTGDMSEFDGTILVESGRGSFFETTTKTRLKSFEQNADSATVFFKNLLEVTNDVILRQGKAEFDMANKGGAGVGGSTIGGKLLMGKASVLLKSGVLSVTGGIEVDGSQENTLTLEGGSGLYLAGSGIVLKSGGDWSKVGINLGAGTLGSASSWALAAKMNLMSVAGTAFDTKEHTMTLDGVLSGTGKLVKSGAGTLILNGDNQFSGGIELSHGVLQLKQASTVSASNDLTMKGSSATLKLGTSGEMTLNKLVLTQGTLSFGNITKLTLNGDVSSTGGSLALSDGMTLVMKGADNKLGTLASAGAGVTLDHGVNALALSVLTQSDYDHLSFTGNGVVSITSAGTSTLTVNKNGLTAYYYAGQGGLTLSGSSLGTVLGVYGGSSVPQVVKSGDIVIGSAGSGITTVLDFGTAVSKSKGIYGAGANLGDTATSGVNKTVLTSISLLGTLTGAGDINETGKSSTTKVTGRLFGGGKEGANVYGSTSLSLTQVHFVGGTGELGEGAGVLVGGGFTGTTVFGDVATKIENSVIDSRVFGAGGSVKGDVSLTIKGARVTGDIYGGSYGSGDVVSGVLSMVLEDSFVRGSIYGLRDGGVMGKVSLSLTNTTVTGNVVAGASHGNEHLKKGAELTLNNVTVGLVGIAGQNYEVVTGDSVINIKGASQIVNFMGTGGGYSTEFSNTLEYGKVTGNLTANISGGTIGAGLSGTEGNLFSMVGRNSTLEGNAYLNITGGTIKNEYICIVGVAGELTGNAVISLSEEGVIESNIRTTTTWGGKINKDLTFILDGGILGLEANTRSLEAGSVITGSGNGKVLGNVNINLNGEESGGVGTFFKGNYSILAGATLGDAVGGNTSVTLSNISKTGGVADFNGIISGANNEGGGVTGSVRSLTFDNYTTSTAAQYKHFTSATVKGGASVTMGATATVSHMGSWDIQDTSKLTLTAAAQLGGATRMNMGDSAELVFNLSGSAAQDAGATALTGSGFITKTGDAKLTLGSEVSGFDGTVKLNAGILSLTGTASDFGEGTEIVLGGGTLMSEKTADFVLNSKLSGTGTLEINNASGKKTTLNNSDSSFTGEMKVNGGIMELGEGVSYRANKVNIGASGRVNLSSLMKDSLGVIEGSGTLHLNNNDGISSGDQLKDFLGTLSIGRNTQFELIVGSTQWVNNAVTVAFNEQSKLLLNNTSGATASLTLGNMSLSGVENQVIFQGEATHLVISNGDDWMAVTAGADVGQLTFDKDEAKDSTIRITNLTNRNLVFANIFLKEGGVTYQSFVNDEGLLGKLTLDLMTELPKSGVPQEDITSYKITGGNTELANGVLTMTGYSNLSSMNIVADETNRGWNLNGNDVLLRSGSLMYQGESYRISGGRLLSDSGLFGIQVANSDWAMTISSEIAEKNGSSTTALKKMGGGKLVLDGKLSNRGGIQVTGGTLQLQGLAVGGSTASNGILSNSAKLILGDGTTDYVLGFAETENKSGATLVVKDKATLGHKVTNAGIVTLEEGAKWASDITLINNKDVHLEIGSGKTMNLDASRISGSGTLHVDSGTAVLDSEIGQSFEVAEKAHLTWNMGSVVNMGKVMTGSGLVQLNNTTGRALDLSSAVLGAIWKDFKGTLNINSIRGDMRVRVSGEMGASKLLVGKGSQYWDACDTAIRSMSMELSGIGYEGTGALRVSKLGTYTGVITIGRDGARISSDGIMVTLGGKMTGGVLEIGSTDTCLSSEFTLSGDNTQTLTRLIGKSRILVASPHGVGQGLDMSSADSGAQLQGAVETGQLTGVAGSSLNLKDGSSLTVTGETNSSFAGCLSGSGDLIKQGLGEWTLSGDNNQSGQVKIVGGKLIVGHDNALGNNENNVFVGESGNLDLSSYAVAQKITLTGGAELSGTGNYTGALSVFSGQGTSHVLGNLNAGSLHLLDSAARLQVNGDMMITGGGSLCLDASNANGNTALVTVNGKLTLRGEYLINLDTNSYYGDKSVKFKLFEAEKYPRATEDYTFALAMDPIYEEFFQLKDNYKQEMVQSGSLTVTINVKAVVGDLVNSGDVAVMGGNGYVSRGESFYLGAKENEGNPVYFDKKYTISAGDNAYRLTNGDGQLQFATQMAGDNKLIISKFVQGSNPDSGVVIANNDNSYTGGTSVLNVHLTVDGSVNTGMSMPESGQIGALGSGAINMLGREAILELRPNGENGGQYRMNNGINLYDGAQLVHSGGSELTLTGAINSGGSAVGVIANNSEQKLKLEGKLTSEQLVFKGMSPVSRAAGESGAIVIAGGAILGSLTLSDQTRVDIQSGTQINTLVMNKGTNLNVGNGSELSIGILTRGSEGSGDAQLNMSGGMLTLLSDTQFGSNEQIKLNLSGGANTLNVADRATVTLSNLNATEGGLSKTGNGILELTGNMSEYVGNLCVGGGLLKVSTIMLRSELTVRGSTAQLEISDNTSLSGKLHISEGGKATLGSTVTLSGELIVGTDSQLATGQNNWLTGDSLSFENGAKAVFGEGTQLGKVDGNTQISMGNNVSLEFGSGSKLNGQIEGGLNFGQGDRYKGELNVGANNVKFGAGSVFEIDGRHYEKYTEGNSMLTGTGTINLEKGMKFELTGFAENMRPLPQTMGLITTTEGILLLDGKEVEHGRFYNEYLSAHPYVWLSFDLLGVNNSLSLYIQKDVRFDLFAQTKNEMAISDVASEIALHAGNYGGELNKLGTVLSAATYDNVRSLLTDLSQTTSSILSGYSVQIQNLRRHTLEIMNRAIQSKPENMRLSYEEANNTFWANGISGTYKMDGDANALGNTTSIWGGSLGMSTTVSETTVIGLAFTYSTSDVQVDRGVGKTTVDAYNIDLFARYHKDNWNITGVVTGGFTSHDIMRTLKLDGYQSQTKSTADGNQFMGMVQAGYGFVVSDDQNSILEPFVFLSGGYSSLDGLSETGAGSAGLNVDSDSTALCSLGAGVRFVREYMVEETSFERGRFEARMMVMQDLTDINPTVHASFQGAANSCFRQEGVAPGKTALLLGVGVVHPLSQTTAMFADVDGEFRDKGTGVGANLGIKYNF